MTKVLRNTLFAITLLFLFLSGCVKNDVANKVTGLKIKSDDFSVSESIYADSSDDELKKKCSGFEIYAVNKSKKEERLDPKVYSLSLKNIDGYKADLYVEYESFSSLVKNDIRIKYYVDYNLNAPSDIIGLRFDSESFFEINYGAMIDKPIVSPTSDNYSFDGWFKEDLVTPFDFSWGGTGCTECTKVYAKWSIKKYSVRFSEREGYSFLMSENVTTVEYGGEVQFEVSSSTDSCYSVFANEREIKKSDGRYLLQNITSDVNVKIAELTGISIKNTFDQSGLKIYVGQNFNEVYEADLKSRLDVIALFDNDTEGIVIFEYNLIADISTSGEKIVTISYERDHFEFTATFKIFVNDIPDGKVEVSKNLLRLALNNGFGSFQLTGTYKERVNGIYSDVSADDFRWKTSDENIAEVDENGIVTASGRGETVVTFSNGVFTAECIVEVYDYAISSIAQFEKIDDDRNASYMLTKDLDFSGRVYNGWSVVDTIDSDGILEGNGYAIKNLEFTKNMRGIILNMNGTLRNIAFTNIVATTGNIERGGLIVLLSKSGVFENVFVQAVVTRHKPSFGGYVGGLVYEPQKGVSGKSVEISDCVVDLRGSATGIVSPFIGVTYKGWGVAAVLKNCYAVDEDTSWNVSTPSYYNGLETCFRANTVADLYRISDNFKDLDKSIWSIDSNFSDMPCLIKTSV